MGSGVGFVFFTLSRTSLYISGNLLYVSFFLEKNITKANTQKDTIVEITNVRRIVGLLIFSMVYDRRTF